jgi:hypothetical protein
MVALDVAPRRRKSPLGRAATAAAGAAAVAAVYGSMGQLADHAAKPTGCAVAAVIADDTQALASWSQPAAGQCRPRRAANGDPLPDPACTPGAVNPSLTLPVLQDAAFKTGPCVRDKATSAQAKSKTYGWYGLAPPPGNTGQHQVCEKDHLVSLELGGADTLDNIWPQCGPDETALNARYFKQKDLVENYLAAQVRAGQIPLAQAQQGIARDWTQYLAPAAAWYARGGAVHNDDEG